FRHRCRIRPMAAYGLGIWKFQPRGASVKIGIIGAGNIGGTLAGRFTALGHEVSIANSRGPETLREVEAETGATPVPIHEAARGKDVVVVTMPVAGDDQAAKSMVMGLVDEL